MLSRQVHLPQNGMSEIKRLKTLLPGEMRHQVVIVRSNQINPALISTAKIGRNLYQLQIDSKRWQQLQFEQRDLLLWDEIARIKNKTVNQPRQDLIVLALGGCVLLINLLVPNLFLLPLTLVVVGLAVNQIYQRYLGEQSLRAAAAADKTAITLAMRFGYSFSTAYSSLYDALKTRSRLAQRLRWKYQVRLQALEIGIRSNQLQHPPIEPPVTVNNRIKSLSRPIAFNEQLN